jgi:hypothetical protein
VDRDGRGGGGEVGEGVDDAAGACGDSVGVDAVGAGGGDGRRSGRGARLAGRDAGDDEQDGGRLIRAESLSGGVGVE